LKEKEMGIKEEIKSISKERGKGKEGLAEAAKVIAGAVSKAVSVKSDEVALLLLTTSGNTMKFIWPPPLFEGNAALPADYQNAFASSVLKTMKGKVDNKVSESKHLKFFENIKGLETSGVPIQKMIAVPLVFEQKAVGVLEVSRKAKTPEAAGANFTPEDGQKLVTLAKEFLPSLLELVPDPFF
jgi:hypothetical protein